LSVRRRSENAVVTVSGFARNFLRNLRIECHVYMKAMSNISILAFLKPAPDK